jgi:hypothetical protein
VIDGTDGLVAVPPSGQPDSAFMTTPPLAAPVIFSLYQRSVMKVGNSSHPEPGVLWIAGDTSERTLTCGEAPSAWSCDPYTFELAVGVLADVPFLSFDTVAASDARSGKLSCLGRFVTRDLSTADDEADSFRFGRPTFLCCPNPQTRSLRVQRRHLVSSGCER